MLKLTGYIEVGKYRFNKFDKVQIESTWENFTDNATFSVPRKLKFEGKKIAEGESLFSKGDEVKIYLGFDYNYSLVFKGFVSKIKPGIMITFTCEDEMYKLKQKNITKSYKSVTLKQLLTDIQPYPVQAVDVQLGKFRVNDTTAAKVLEFIREEYGLYCWFRQGKLYAGLAYQLELSKRHVFRFGHNIIDSENLQFESKDAVPMKVKAVSINSKNEKIEIQEPENAEADAELRTLYKYNVDKATLRHCAKEFLQATRYSGFSGDFETFGGLNIQHGDVAVMQDTEHPDKNGNYLIKKTVTTAGSEGFFQSIYLHSRVK